MTNILIADDHHLIRAGLVQILAERPNMKVYEADNGNEALQILKDEVIDVMVLDISMPGKNGLDVLKELKESPFKVPVLILSTYPEDQYAVRALKAGASGYLTKDSAPDNLLAAIEKVMKGGKYISSQVTEKLLNEIDRDSDKAPHEVLSDREFEVLKMIGSGKTVSEIAEEMYLSVKTVSTYRARLLKKMSLKNNSELTHYVISNELLK